MPKSRSKTSRFNLLSPQTVRMATKAIDASPSIPQKVIVEAMREIPIKDETDMKVWTPRANSWLRDNYPGLIRKGVTAALLGLAIYAAVLYGRRTPIAPKTMFERIAETWNQAKSNATTAYRASLSPADRAQFDQENTDMGIRLKRVFEIFRDTKGGTFDEWADRVVELVDRVGDQIDQGIQ